MINSNNNNGRRSSKREDHQQENVPVKRTSSLSSKQEFHDNLLKKTKPFPPEVKSVLQQFEIKQNDYKDIMKLFDREMKRGLQKATHEKADVKMLPTYVTQLPTGKGKTECLAVDLGGTNYRIIYSCFDGSKLVTTKNIIKEIPPEILTSTGEALFGFIAVSVKEFLIQYQLMNKQLPLGFTFSFPCKQVGLKEAILIKWCKGFNCTNTVGKDVSKMLQIELDKLNLNVNVIAVVNDTVGTLAFGSLSDPNCCIGLIVGTGSNAAYLENISKMELYEAPESNAKECVVNMEWGAFGVGGYLDKWRTPYDKMVDSESLYPGQQIFEKMVSGMYLGEIVRLVFRDLTQKKLLFNGKMYHSLGVKNSITCKHIAECERDPPKAYYSTEYMLTHNLGVTEFSRLDVTICRYVCQLVCTRSAFLVGTGLAAVMTHINKPNITIAVDGSLFKFHPRYAERMIHIISVLASPKSKFMLILSEDGSGLGAALIAAAEQQNKTAAK